MTKNIAALICGILFGIGLTISQMSNPDKVLAFLDITGNWDLSLMLVMFGALTTLSVAQYFILKRPKPVCDSQFHLPKKGNLIDTRLILGAVIFGVGWGLVGYVQYPRVVDQTAQHTHFLVHALKQALDVGFDAHIGLESLGLAARGADFLHHAVGGLRVTGVIDRHSPTLLGRQQGGGGAYAATGTGDE